MDTVNKLSQIGRISQAEMTDSEIIKMYDLKDKGVVRLALFKEKRNGELISLQPYFYLAHDTRSMNGFCREI